MNRSDQAVVDIRGVEFSWEDSTQPLLTIADFKLGQNESVFIHGGSGSGKSTFLSLIAGVTKPQKGDLRILGLKGAQLSAFQRDRLRADHMGYIFQNFNLVPYASVLENVRLGLAFSPLKKKKLGSQSSEISEAKRLLQALGLSENLFATLARNLSVGQQQRVAAARALMGGPELLLADEPTSALDKKNRDQFLDLLFAECAKSQTSIIYVSHDIETASKFGRMISMDSFH